MWAVSGRVVLAYSVYPYPLEGELDQELLAAHAEVHRFKDWPGRWKDFLVGWRAVGGTKLCIIRSGMNGASSEPCSWTEETRSKYLMHRSLVDALK